MVYISQNEKSIIFSSKDNAFTKSYNLSSILTKEKDFKVINISYDGLSTIDNYTKLKPDILLLDLARPKCNGIEVLNSINVHTKYSNMIILSDSDELFTKICNTSKFDWRFSKTVSQPKLFETIRTIKESNTEIEKKLDYIFSEFLFDLKDKTELMKSAILIKYKYPNLKMDDLMKKVVEENPAKVKNTSSAYLIINRCYNKVLKRHNSLDDFSKIFLPAFKYNPTLSNFISQMAYYLKSTYK